MKKILICLLACVMLLTMVGCSPEIEDIRGDQTEEKELSLGHVTGKKYISEFIGIGYNLDEDWEFYTDEEIRELNNYVEDIAGQDYQELIKNATVFYDMMASSSSGTDNVVVTLEKTSNVKLSKLDLAQTLESSFSAMKTSFESMGYTNVTHEVTTVKIDGETFHVMHVSASFAGMTMQQASVLIKCNGYLASLAVTTFDEAGTAPLLDNIYLLK